MCDEVRHKFPCDADHLLQKALTAALVGKICYFGFKSSASVSKRNHKQVTLRDILDANQRNKTHSSESHKEGVVAFQMFPACQDAKENQCTVMSVLSDQMRRYAANLSTNSTSVNSTSQDGSLSSNDHGCNTSCNASKVLQLTHQSYRNNSSGLNPFDNQSSLVLSCDSIHESCLHGTSHHRSMGKHKSLLSTSHLEQDLVQNNFPMAKVLSNLDLSTSNIVKLEESIADNTVDMSIEQFRSGSRSSTSIQGSVQMAVSMMHGIDFDETLDMCGDLLSRRSSQDSKLQCDVLTDWGEENDITIEADCSSILVPLNRPNSSHELRDHEEPPRLCSSTDSLSSEQGTLPKNTQEIPPDNSPVANHQSLTEHHDISEQNALDLSRRVSLPRNNSPPVRELPSDKPLPAVSVDSWESMPESEDLSQFLRDLDNKADVLKTPVMVRRCEPSGQIHDFITSFSELCSQRRARLCNRITNCTKSSSTSDITDRSCASVKMSLFTDVPLSEDLDAFLQELDENETMSSMGHSPQMKRQLDHQTMSLDCVNNPGSGARQNSQDHTINTDGSYLQINDSDCSLDDLSKMRKSFTCDSSVGSSSSSDTSSSCGTPADMSSGDQSLNLVLSQASVRHSCIELSCDDENAMSCKNDSVQGHSVSVIPTDNVQGHSVSVNVTDLDLGHSVSVNVTSPVQKNYESFDTSSHSPLHESTSGYPDNVSTEEPIGHDDNVVKYSESLFGDSTIDASFPYRSSIITERSCINGSGEDMFDCSEDLFGSSSHLTPSGSMEGAGEVLATNITNSSSDGGSFISMYHNKPGSNVLSESPKLQTVQVKGVKKLKRKSVHFPSSSRLAETENISSIDRLMKVNCDVSAIPLMSESMLPEKSCLRRSEELVVDAGTYEPVQCVHVHRTIADLFTVSETPVPPRSRSSSGLLNETESDRNSSLNLQNAKCDLSHVMMQAEVEVNDDNDMSSNVPPTKFHDVDCSDKSGSDSCDSIIAGSQDLFGDGPTPPQKKHCFKLPNKISRPASSSDAVMHESTPIASPRITKKSLMKKKLSLSKTPKRLTSQKIMEAFSFSSMDESSECVKYMSSSQGSEDLFSDEEMSNYNGEMVVTGDHGDVTDNVMANSYHNSTVDSSNQACVTNSNHHTDSSDESCIGDSQDLFDD